MDRDDKRPQHDATAATATGAPVSGDALTLSPEWPDASVPIASPLVRYRLGATIGRGDIR